MELGIPWIESTVGKAQEAAKAGMDETVEPTVKVKEVGDERKMSSAKHKCIALSGDELPLKRRESGVFNI